MTTIAYRNGIIAADTGLVGGGLKDCQMNKIAKRADGAVAGACGAAWWIQAFLTWFQKGGDMPHSKSSSYGIVVRSPRSLIQIFESDEGTTRRLKVRAPYYAIGSGCRIAIGAMFAGATPTDAVRAAMAHDDSTYGRVTSLRMGK